MSVTPTYTPEQTLLRSYDDLLKAFRVVGSTGGGGGGMLAGVTFDAVVASYPNSVTEVFQFKTGGVGGTLAATITVVYTDSTKAFISTAVKT